MLKLGIHDGRSSWGAESESSAAPVAKAGVPIVAGDDEDFWLQKIKFAKQLVILLKMCPLLIWEEK